MASTQEYLDFIIDQFAPAGEVTSRAMMGEYLLYYKGKLFGGIYDDRLLVKPVEAARALMPFAELQVPYEGAKEMLLVDDLENPGFLCELLEAIYPELPEPKPKKKKA